MSEAIEALLKSRVLKDFVKLFKEQEQECETPLNFAGELAHYLCRRTYQRYYDDDLPHTFFGLAAAVNSLPSFPEDRKWWPLVQQTWSAANSRLRTPWSENGAQPMAGGTRDERFQSFSQGLEESDFAKTWSAAKSLMGGDAETRDWFRSQSLKRALNDTFEDGVKLLFLDQSWRLAEAVDWKDSDGILFPALHLLALAPRQTELSQLARKNVPGNHILAQKKTLDDDDYPGQEKALLFAGSVEEGLRVLQQLAQRGIGWEGCWSFLLLAAAQMVGNAKPGRWISAVRAFLFACTAFRLCERLDESARVPALAIATALVANSSLHTRQTDRSAELDKLAQELCPTDTFNTLRSVVSHSDPYASANAVYAILGMDSEKHAELFQSLATLAAKNGGHQGKGYDLLLVQAAVDCYRRSSSKYGGKFLTNTAFVLGRMPKSYDLFGAYGV